MYRAVFLVALAAISRAQFLSTDDGSALYFTTSSRIAGTEQSFRSKLFSWDTVNGIRLVYEAEGDISAATISGDGLFAAFGSTNASGEGYLLNTRSGMVERLPGPAVISRNGRFLFDGATLTDRERGTARSQSVVGPPYAVGNDGTVIYKTRDQFRRIEPDGTERVLRNGARFESLGGIDENATKAIITGIGSAGFLMNAITGEVQAIAPELGGNIGPPVLLSGDGQWFTYVTSLPPAYQPETAICRVDNTGCKLLTTPPIGTRPIAISRRGEVVFAAFDEAILQIDTATGRTERPFILPAAYPEWGGPFVPGSTVRFRTSNPGTLATLNGQPVPVIERSERGLLVQIPWETTGTVEFTMLGGESPFETKPLQFAITDYNPLAIAPPDVGPLENSAFKQDWSATTYESPARPGEILHAIVTGLGAVACSIRTNEPAPLDHLCPITRSIEWGWYPSGQPAEVLFAGLAPAMIGIYQIDVRVPRDAAAGFMALSDNAGHPRIVWVRVGQ